jgi:hypothetical protein
MSSPLRLPCVLSPHNADIRILSGQLHHVDPRRTKVAITGAGKSLRHLPWNNEEWEIWGINNFWNAMRDSEGRLRADRWFELHPPTPDIQDKHDMAWLKNCPVPIYTTEPFPGNDNAVTFPLAAITGEYGNYFTCTFAYQIALAIYEGFEELALHGLELAYGTQREATVERACVNWWLGYAEGQGMKITIPEDDFVLRHWGLYGFDYWKEANAVKQYVGSLIGRKVAE